MYDRHWRRRYGARGETVPFMLAFGDSIVEGTGSSDAAHAWAYIVAASRLLPLNVQAIGGTVLQNTIQNTVSTIGGAADYNGRDTYTTRITAFYPPYVYIHYGLNDLRLNDVAFSAANYQNDLDEIVAGVVANGTPAQDIVIGSPSYIPVATYALYPPWDGGSLVIHAAYTAACAAVAAARGTRYADVYQYMADNGDDALISVDGLHPNDAGHAAIAVAMLAAV